MRVILLVIVRVDAVFVSTLILPPNVILPPERVIFPVADPKFIRPEVTLPDTVIVPSASPVVLVPNHRVSAAVVFIVPDMTFVPAEERLQPWVASFVVGAAQVPCAVPKPAVESFESQ